MITRLVTAAPVLIFAAAIFTAGIWAVIHSIRGRGLKLTALVRAARWLTRRRVPAAHDNHQGTDTDALWACRRIARQLLIDPNIARPANNYRPGEETP